MPASMITAWVALSPKVTGSRIEMPDSGPMPGSTPTRVPTTQPRNAYQRLSGWKAMAKPCAKLIRVFSTNGVLEVVFRKGCLEPVHERNISEQDDGYAVDAGAYRIAPLDDNQQRDHHEQHGDREAELLLASDRDGGDDRHHGGMFGIPPTEFGERPAFLGAHDQYQAENDGQRSDNDWQETGAGHG